MEKDLDEISNDETGTSLLWDTLAIETERIEPQMVSSKSFLFSSTSSAWMEATIFLESWEKLIKRKVATCAKSVVVMELNN